MRARSRPYPWCPRNHSALARVSPPQAGAMLPSRCHAPTPTTATAANTIPYLAALRSRFRHISLRVARQIIDDVCKHRFCTAGTSARMFRDNTIGLSPRVQHAVAGASRPAQRSRCAPTTRHIADRRANPGPDDTCKGGIRPRAHPRRTPAIAHCRVEARHAPARRRPARRIASSRPKHWPAPHGRFVHAFWMLSG